MNLKLCRWRSPTINPNLIQCRSAKIVGQKFAVPLALCGQCPYTDHEPVSVPIPVSWSPCEHRGERRLHPPIAPDNVRDWRECGHPDIPLGKVVCQCRGCSPQCTGYSPSENVEEQEDPVPDSFVAPLGDVGRWNGRKSCLSNQADVTVVIPHLNTLDFLVLAVKMWRYQTPRPYIMIVDTGSSTDVLAQMEKLRADDCEIHHIRAGSYCHSSAPVGVAMDLAFALVSTPYLFSTHSDVFPRSRKFLPWMQAQCNAENPVVGWQMSPRSGIGDRWERCVSHTATMWHAARMRDVGLTWNFRWWYEHTADPVTMVGWPDTESPPALALQQAGIVPKLLGSEPNHELHETDWFWHARSQASLKAYAPDSPQAARGFEYGNRAKIMALALLQKWKEEG